MTVASSNFAKRAKALNEELLQNLESIRDKITGLKDQRKLVEKQYVDKATALARVDVWTDVMVERARRYLPSVASFAGNNPHFRPPETDFDAVVALALAPVIQERMRSQIEEFYGEEAGIPDAERKQLLSDADREILDLEMAEESIIRHAEGAGISINRRADADPRAVLAHVDALP
jgi:hypothetical protein